MKKILPAFFLVLLFSAPVHAQDNGDEYLKARLLSSQTGAGKLDAHRFALELTMEKGWYTYWRMPGDNGVATAFDWKDSKNVSDVEIFWPAPERINAFDMNSFGYHDSVILPLIVTPAKKGQAVNLDIKIDAVVCHEICVPQTVRVSYALPAGKTAASPEKAKIDKAFKTLPLTKDSEKLRVETAVLGKSSLAVPLYAKGGFGNDFDMMVDVEGAYLTRPPAIVRDKKDKTRAVLTIEGPEGLDLPSKLFGRKAHILVINGDDALEKEFTF